MKQLWAPWRMAYLERGSDREGCFLCAIGAGSTGEPIVVWRGTHVYALLNAYPYSNGHVMVAPYAHEGDLTALGDDAATELMATVRWIVRALRLAFAPEGFNIGANLGAAAGAGFADHLHFHIVPRWRGDTNFMTTTGNTRVIPEALDDTAERLREALAAITLETDEESQTP